MTPESITREYPSRPIASVAVCVLKGKRVLVIKRATPPSQGLWSVPGGVIELGESIQEAACREIEEECGIKIAVGEIFTVENLVVPDETGRVRFHYVVTYLAARHLTGEVCADSDALEARWMTAEELGRLEMNPIVRRNMLKAFEIAGSAG